MPTGNQVYKYASPQPFATPFIEDRLQGGLPAALQALAFFLPRDIFPHEQLMYSGPLIENLMFNLNRELDFRGAGQRDWKLYKTGPNDFDTFRPAGNTEGILRPSIISNYPVKWFPLYIKDMQEVITDLMTIGGIPDDIGSAMARIFGNNVAGGPGGWNGINRIRSSYIVPRSSETQSSSNNETISVDVSSTFPFPASSNHVANPGVRMGIDFRGQAFVRRGETGIVTSDPDWPRSVIGKRRTDEDVTIVQGQLEEREGSSVTGIDGIHVEMTSEGRPEHERIIRETEAPLPGAVGRDDLESGYGWFAHHPLVLQQCRFQPPSIETWDNTTTCKDYVENVFSNQTPNLPWYFSQEVEKQHFGDWGGWIIQGRGCIQNGIQSEAYADPQHESPVTNCPFSIFYPPPSSNCSCIDSNTAYAIWTSSAEPLEWNLRTWFNFGRTADPKFFGPKTRMRVNGTLSAGAGAGGTASVWIGIRTVRISPVNLQPFVAIIGIGDIDVNSPGSLDVNIMDALAFHYDFYDKEGSDAILAVGIFATTSTDLRATVDAVDGPSGPFIPPTDLGCKVGTSFFNLSYLQLYEPPLSIDDDVRLPALEDPQLTDPPSYGLPQLG